PGLPYQSSAACLSVRLERCTGGGGTTQKALRAQILIDVRPMDAIAATRDAPVLPLRRRGVEQARIPSQGDRDGPPVPQSDAKRVLAKFHIGNPLISRQRQDAHAR